MTSRETPPKASVERSPLTLNAKTFSTGWGLSLEAHRPGPRAGATHAAVHHPALLLVSIHAPRAGGDFRAYP